MMNYTLIRSRRKTVAIHITKNAEMEVRAPLKMAQVDIDKFVLSKQDWIVKHLTTRKQHLEQKATFKLNYGDILLLQGKTYPIIAKTGNRVGFDSECFYIPPDLSPEEIKHAVIQVYKLTAKRILTNKVIDYAKKMNITPTAVKINSAKTRWGSCSGKNSINFTWRLVMADDAVIDCVIVHELAHIKEHNHSERFWTVVAAMLPDYKVKQKGLKDLQKRFMEQD